MNSLLQGLGGYTRRVRSRAPTGITSTKQTRQKPLRNKVSKKPQGECLALPPEARGLLSDTKKGVP